MCILTFFAPCEVQIGDLTAGIEKLIGSVRLAQSDHRLDMIFT